MDHADLTSDLEVVDLEARAPEERPRRRPERKDDTGPRHRRRGVRVVVVIALLVVTVAGSWGLMAQRRLADVRSDLMGTRATFVTARDALVAGDLDAADAAFAQSSSTLGTIPGRLEGLLVAPVRLVPAYRRTIDAVVELTNATAALADIGLRVTQVLTTNEGGLGALAPRDGRIPVEVLIQLGPVLADARLTLAEATRTVADIPSVGLVPDVMDARAEFLALAGSISDQVDVIADVTALLPGLLGQDGPRTYLVAASNPTEARGTGGYLGAFTMLSVEDGRLTFGETQPIQDLPILPPGSIPWPDPSMQARYDRYGGTGFMQNINMSPDFPSVAVAIERYVEEVLDIRLDGVIATDPYAFESLLRIAGPIELPGYGEISADTVVDFVAHDAYALITDFERRKRLIGDVAVSAFQRFLDTPDEVPTAAVLDAVADIASRQSLVVHAVDPQEQEILARLGMTGRLGAAEPGDYLGVFLNSGAPYKVDYWLQRTIGYDVALGPEGSVAGSVLLGFENIAPTSGEPEYMIGMGQNGLDVGDVLSYVSVYCAPGCVVDEVPDAGYADLSPDTGVELGYGVSSTWMRLPAGQQRQMAFSRDSPDGWAPMGQDRVYTLHYGHQTSIIPTRLDVSVRTPEGFVATVLPEGARVEGDAVRLSAEVTESRTVQVVFSPIDP